MNKTYFPNFNPDITLFSGQGFAWEKRGNTYYGKFQNVLLKLEYRNDHLFWQSYPKKDDFEFVANYFLLNENQLEILGSIDDTHVKQAVKKYKGLRLLNADFEQSILSFVLATNKQIVSIRKSIQIISQSQGKNLEVDGHRFSLFPDAAFILDAPESLLKSSGIGYRVPYIKNAATFALENDIQSVTREKLLSVKGIGDKVADCVLTFSLGVRNRTPIDIWGDRIFENLYNKKPVSNYEKKQKFFQKKFGAHTALAGQYLFEYIREYKPEKYYEIN